MHLRSKGTPSTKQYHAELVRVLLVYVLVDRLVEKEKRQGAGVIFTIVIYYWKNHDRKIEVVTRNATLRPDPFDTGDAKL